MHFWDERGKMELIPSPSSQGSSNFHGATARVQKDPHDMWLSRLDLWHLGPFDVGSL